MHLAAASVTCRGLLAAASVTMALNASGAIDATYFTPPIARLLEPEVTAPGPRLIDYHWHTANWLAAVAHNTPSASRPQASSN